MNKQLLSLFLLISTFIANANSGFLGITIKNYQDKETKAVQISEAIKNGAAQLQGLKDNDIITHINGVKIETKESLVATVGTYNVGDVIKVDYIRNNKAESKKIKLGEKPTFKDYKVQIKKTGNDEQWIFTNDNSSITIKNNEIADYTYVDGKGVNNTFAIKNISDNSLSSPFNDIDEKISVINSLKKGQASCNCNCSFYAYRYYNFPEQTKSVVETPKEDIKINLVTDKFNVYPNPTSGEFLVEFATKEQGTAYISILDVTGRVIKTHRIQNFEGSYSNKFDLKNEARGTYIVQIKVGEKLATSKILLQ